MRAHQLARRRHAAQRPALVAQASFIGLAGVPMAWVKILKNVSAQAMKASASSPSPRRCSSGGTWLAMAPHFLGWTRRSPLCPPAPDTPPAQTARLGQSAPSGRTASAAPQAGRPMPVRAAGWACLACWVLPRQAHSPAQTPGRAPCPVRPCPARQSVGRSGSRSVTRRASCTALNQRQVALRSPDLHTQSRIHARHGVAVVAHDGVGGHVDGKHQGRGQVG